MMAQRFLHNTRATASVEFALLLPMLIILLFGGMEAGNFVWSQHKLAEAVRDGARYAARLPIDKVCDGPTAVLTDPEEADIKLLTRTGQLDDPAARAVVPGWADAQVDVTITCESFVATGIYTDLGAEGPIVTVSATGVAYPSMFKGLGSAIPANLSLSARANAAVIGL